MKLKILVFLILAGNIIPSLLFAQFTQQGPKFVGTGSAGISQQGSSVAISSDGNTAVVGGPFDNDSTGAVWIFTRSGGVWIQQGPKLVGNGLVNGYAYQGFSVAISYDGNTVIVGGNRDNNYIGAAWIFTRTAGVWTQQGPKLVGAVVSGASGQGTSVSISADGNTAIVGGPGDNLTGSAWIFTRSGGIWSQSGPKLVGTGITGTYAEFGYSVAISSDGINAVVGGYRDNNFAGALWVFTLSGGMWLQQGPKLVGTGAAGNSYQGISVAISSNGNTIIEGGNKDNSNSGAVWVFTRSGGVWSQQGSKFNGTGAVGSAIYQGSSVAISSDGITAVESGFYDNFGAGALWVFTRSGNVWTQQGPKLVGTNSTGNAWQGTSVAISSNGTTIIEGGFGDNNYTGASWVFYRPRLKFVNHRNNLSKPILGNLSALDTISITTDYLTSYYVSNVNVTIDTINYPIDGDLEISLIHSTKTDTLVYQLGGSGANFIGTVLRDSASALISSGTPPFSGEFKPTKALSQFINTDPNGDWILRVYDRNSGHTGTLQAWTLTVDVSQNLTSAANISGEIPKVFSLSQNYPNPFNPNTKIAFALPRSSFAKLVVYDMLGREVETLFNGQLTAGFYESDFNAGRYSSGVYYYKLDADGYTETKKMILIK